MLGSNGSGGRDAVRWVDEEGDKDLADPGLGRVLEAERLDLVLIDVREGDTTALEGFDTSKFLQTFVITGGGSLSEFMDGDNMK